MAHLNISVLNTGGSITNAVLVISDQAATNLESILKTCGNLMPAEMLENIASTIKHLGDVKYLSNADMIKMMESEAKPIDLDDAKQGKLLEDPAPVPAEPYTTGPLDNGQAPAPEVTTGTIPTPAPEVAPVPENVPTEPAPQA